MKTTLLLCLVILSLAVQAEDFAEFKAPPLSETEQKLVTKKLMDWSITHNANAEKKLIDAEYDAIKNYGRVDYDIVNEYMHMGEPIDYINPSFGQSLKRRVSYMRSVMKKLPNYKGTVFRGATIKNPLLEKLNIGDILHEKAFLSTSVNPAIAQNFGSSQLYEGVSNAQFKIELKSAGRAINAYTFKPDEAEVLAKPNTYFRVEAIEKISPKKNYIKLREIKNPQKYVKTEPDVHVYDSFSGEEVIPINRVHFLCL